MPDVHHDSDDEGTNSERRHALMEENKRVESEMLDQIGQLRAKTAQARQRLLEDELRLRRRRANGG